MIKDYNGAIETWHNHVETAFFTENFATKNFCGKTVAIAGGQIPSGSQNDTCVPGYIQDFYFDAIAASAIAQSGAKPSNVTDKLLSESAIIGVKPLAIYVTNDKLSGIEYYLDGDCAYFNDALASGAWQVLYYGVPTPFEP